MYHRAVTVRALQNKIKEIQRSDGVVVDTPEGVKVEAERYFREFLQEQPTDFEGISVENLEGILPLPFLGTEQFSADSRGYNGGNS